MLDGLSSGVMVAANAGLGNDVPEKGVGVVVADGVFVEDVRLAEGVSVRGVCVGVADGNGPSVWFVGARDEGIVIAGGCD